MSNKATAFEQWLAGVESFDLGPTTDDHSVAEAAPPAKPIPLRKIMFRDQTLTLSTEISAQLSDEAWDYCLKLWSHIGNDERVISVNGAITQFGKKLKSKRKSGNPASEQALDAFRGVEGDDWFTVEQV